MKTVVRRITNSCEETIALGKKLGSLLRGGEVLAMTGDLGSGKTTFTKGLAEGLGIHGTVFSPTFTLVHEYPGPIKLYHIDLYRISGEEAIEDLGLEEYFDAGGVCVIEWSERLGCYKPPNRIDISIVSTGEDERSIEIAAIGPDFEPVISSFCEEKICNLGK